MADFRATFFFELGKYGWSETFFMQSAGYGNVAIKAKALAELRLPLCGTGVRLPYIRISDDAVRRDAVVLTPNYVAGADVGVIFPGKPVIIGLAFDSSPDVPYSAILLRMNTVTPTTWRMHYLRGVPDPIVGMPHGPNLPAKWKDAFTEWGKELVNGGWGFKAIDTDPGTNPTRPITGVSGSAPFTLTVVNHGFTSGDVVRVSGLKGVGKKAVNGLWAIDNLGVDSIRLRGSSGVFTYDSGGTVRLQKKKFITITEALIRGQTHRDTGRPFDSPRGRRKREE